MRPNLNLTIILFALLSGSLLTGCAGLTPAERSVRMQQEIDEMIQVYGPACEKLGFKKDTDPWRECILKLNRDALTERLTARMQSATDCWGYHGFFHCSPF